MRRARLLLLLLLLPARAASLWALPRCELVLVCHMGPDGSACCPEGGCSMKDCKGSEQGVLLAPTPSLPPVSAVRLPDLAPIETVLHEESSEGTTVDRDVPHPPPRPGDNPR